MIPKLKISSRSFVFQIIILFSDMKFISKIQNVLEKNRFWDSLFLKWNTFF